MKEEKAKKGLLDRILDTIERVGNRLPDPITLFLGLAIVVVLISWLCSALGAKALNPATNEMVEVKNLFSVYGLQYLWSNVITNFSGFAPLGMVLVAVIGSSVSEKSGFLVALMERFLGGAKGWIVSMVIIFLGINLNIAAMPDLLFCRRCLRFSTCPSGAVPCWAFTWRSRLWPPASVRTFFWDCLTRWRTALPRPLRR